MCGFLGEYTFQNNPITEAVSFEALLALSKQRGPDSTGIQRGDNFQLGFNRLAILDTSSRGNQPKQSPSGRYHVVFNGELYNFKELAKTYNLEHLPSTSDTEVLIHVLDVLGVADTITSLNGMFAIAIVDAVSNCLYLARDFAGIKPLYYGVASQGMVVASQFDQVFKHPWLEKHLTLRPDTVKEYFGLGYMQAPNTIYQQLYQVSPGELLCVDKAGTITKRELLTFGRRPLPKNSQTALSIVLETAVSSQLVSDVPIASFLSGGIDSPLISAYAKKHKPDIETFTLEVAHSELNESAIAMAYARHLNLKQHIVSVTEVDLLSEIDAHFEAYSEPFGDYSSIPTYVISKEAKKQHTVMLSGDGGDELFFGYPRMLDVLKKRWWFLLPYPIRKPLAALTNKLGLTKTWAPYFKDLGTFILNKHVQLPVATLDAAFQGVSFSKELNRLYTFKFQSATALLHHLRWNEFYAHLQRVLIKVDRASMAHSLEVRVPFLDKTIIKWAWQQQGNLKNKTDLKKELKKLLAEEVPESLINQKKMGFTVPLESWLHTTLKQDVVKVVLETAFYGAEVMDVSVLRQYVQDFFDKKHHNAWGVWHIYAWQKWWQKHRVGES